MDPQLYLTSGVAIVFAIMFAFSTKGILYATPDTDNEMMIYAAAQSHKWKWLSDLHKYGVGKTGMKDLSVIMISFFQKILRDKESDYPYVVLGGFATVFSAILIYLIGSNYWSLETGLFVSMLFLFSLWNWQIALYGGHVNVATMFFLLSVLFIQQSDSGILSPEIWMLGAGAMFCFTQFASASSIKYAPLFFGSLFYAEHGYLITQGEWLDILLSSPGYAEFLNIILPTLLILAFITAKLTCKKIVTMMYYQKAPDFLNKLIEGRDLFPIDYYIDHANRKVNFLMNWSIWAVMFLLVLINFVALDRLIYILAGFFAAFLILTLPDIKKSLRYYFNFLLETQIIRKTHFKSYIDHFAKKGVKVTRYTRGAGLSWVPKILFRIIPIHTIIFFAAIIISLIYVGKNLYNPFSFSLLLFVALSPIIWAELTKAPQLARTYSPSLIGMLLIIGNFVYISQNIYANFWVYAWLAGITALAWNLWEFLSDIYPSRMGATKLVKILNNLNIKDIYTYRTNYNKGLVETIPGLGESAYVPRKKIEPPFSVHYINSINDVRDGWIIVPGTNGRAITMDGEQEAIGDNFRFTKDPILNKLLESHDIEKVATAKIKTYGTSRIWSNECEALSFMDVILREITKEDLYRGHAWLVHTSKLNN